MAGRVWGEDGALLARAGLDVAALEALELRELAAGRDAVGAAAVWDAHVHLGRDADGHRLAVDELLEDLDRAGCAGAVCFAANDPGPRGDFGPANAAVLAAARRAGGRVVPFCRVDPRRPGALEAMERAAAGGARGLKLHPVAQRFALDWPEVVEVVAAAAVRRWPMVIHAGFGVRPVADPLGRLLEAVPDATVILAHGGRGDARDLTRLCRRHAGIHFDTSLAALTDLVGLPPERLCFGSDRPYGEHAGAIALVAAAGRHAGWDAGQWAAVWGGNLRRLLGPA